MAENQNDDVPTPDTFCGSTTVAWAWILNERRFEVTHCGKHATPAIWHGSQRVTSDHTEI